MKQAADNIICPKCAYIRTGATKPTVNNQSDSINQGTAGTYQIVASSPILPITSYGATSLPSGVTLNSTTGVLTIANTVTVGSYSIPISATNVAGTGTGTLTLTVNSTANLSFVASSPVYTGGTGPTNLLSISIDGGSFFAPAIGTSYVAYSSLVVKAAATTVVMDSSILQAFYQDYTITPSGGAVVSTSSGLSGNTNWTGSGEFTFQINSNIFPDQSHTSATSPINLSYTPTLAVNLTNGHAYVEQVFLECVASFGGFITPNMLVTNTYTF